MELEVLNVKHETPTIVTVTFKKPNIDYKPGNYFVIVLDVDDPKGNFRDFSSASSPTEDVIIISSRITKSEFKKKLSSLKPGDKVTVKGPFGHFLLMDNKDIVMIAGGIGITPFRSMLKYLADVESTQKVTLFYGSKNPEEIAFFSDLEEFSKKNKNIKIIITVNDPKDLKKDYRGLTGLIDANMIKYNTSVKNKYFYICGPVAMVDSMTNQLKSIGVSESDIRVEHFTGY